METKHTHGPQWRTIRSFEREAAYQEHERNTDDRGVHVDGCFYCGGDHPSDCCRASDRDEYWEA